MTKIFSYLKNYKGKFALAVIFNALAALFTVVSIPLVIPFFQILFETDISQYSLPENGFDLESYLGYYFSRLIAISDKKTALGFVCIVIVVVVLLRNIFRYLAVYFHTPVRNGIVRDLRLSLVENFLQLPLKERRYTSVGEMLSISSNDIVEVEWSVIRVIELLVKSPVLIIGSLALMFLINLKLSIISIFLLIVVGSIIGLLSRNLKAKSGKTQSLLAVLNQKIEEIASSIKTIKAYQAEDFFKKRFSKINNVHFKKNNEILRRRDLASPLSEFLGVVLVVILIWIGARLVISHEMRPETFFAFIFAFYNVIEPFKSLSTAFYHVKKGQASLERIENYLTTDHSKALVSGKKNIDLDWEELSFEDVSYSYGGKNVLENISIKIPRGKSIALVGRSGAGKSTLIDLLLRMDDPDSGRIKIDESDIKDYRISEYRDLFGYLSQEPVFFEGSVEDNIALEIGVNEESLDRALAHAGATDFLNEKSTDSNLKEKGSNYSLGQRQRLAIARAFYYNREVLVLDEGTTAMDAETEKQVLDAIDQLSKDKTLVIISHRFRLIKNVDLIYVIDQGKIVNSGTHEDLISTNTLYKELLSYQEA